MSQEQVLTVIERRKGEKMTIADIIEALKAEGLQQSPSGTANNLRRLCKRGEVEKIGKRPLKIYYAARG